jgi:Flp pilus assembly protein TadG
MYAAMIAFWRREAGAAAIFVGVVLFLLVGLGAIVVELTLLYVAQNELRNGADAGALAGAADLYLDDGTAVNTGANQTAFEAAIANKSQNSPVEVGAGDVLRGHWSFLDQAFTPNETTTEPPILWDRSPEDLDRDTDFINAVQVTTRREATPITLFFARLFGIDQWTLQQTSVGYLGFAGSLDPGEADQPIAVCREALVRPDTEEYTCTVGRMLSDSDSGGGDPQATETAVWTDLVQPCDGASSASEVRPLICGSGNEDPLVFGGEMSVTNGVVMNNLEKFRDCWLANSRWGQEPWEMNLPVVICEGGTSSCNELDGVVTINVLWVANDEKLVPQDSHEYSGFFTTFMQGKGDKPNWTAPVAAPELEADYQQNWDSFVRHFNLLGADDLPARFLKKTVYFLPDCSPHERQGTSIGTNYGVIAKYPVLVE